MTESKRKAKTPPEKPTENARPRRLPLKAFLATKNELCEYLEAKENELEEAGVDPAIVFTLLQNLGDEVCHGDLVFSRILPAGYLCLSGVWGIAAECDKGDFDLVGAYQYADPGRGPETHFIVKEK